MFSPMQVRKNRKARMAVVRVRVSAAPRAREQAAHAAAAAAHAQRAAFGALQQHKDDQRHGDDQFGDKQQGLHGSNSGERCERSRAGV